MVKVAVLGAGVNGMTCALRIKEKYPNFDVVVFTKDLSPNTTGDGSGGLWYPYLCGETPAHLLSKWGGETYNYLYQKWLEGGLDISLMPIYVLYRNANISQRQSWADNVFGYRELEQPQLNFLSQVDSFHYTSGHTFITFIAQTSTFLKYLCRQFEEAGGKVLRTETKSLGDPALVGFDLVVNCTGIGARDVVPDRYMYPVRGQVARVLAPWFNATIIDEDGGNYIIPNAENCVLGGTHQEHDFNTNIDKKDSNFILDGCIKISPGLKHAQLIKEWAGLRPGRHEVRLELELRHGRAWIHNYGHGGSGFTLFWGCASNVLDILEKYLNYLSQNHKPSPSGISKL